eukprot:7832538-Pyramimonas_sp.AAC.1
MPPKGYIPFHGACARLGDDNIQYIPPKTQPAHGGPRPRFDPGDFSDAPFEDIIAMFRRPCP